MGCRTTWGALFSKLIECLQRNDFRVHASAPQATLDIEFVYRFGDDTQMEGVFTCLRVPAVYAHAVYEKCMSTLHPCLHSYTRVASCGISLLLCMWCVSPCACSDCPQAIAHLVHSLFDLNQRQLAKAICDATALSLQVRHLEGQLASASSSSQSQYHHSSLSHEAGSMSMHTLSMSASSSLSRPPSSSAVPVDGESSKKRKGTARPGAVADMPLLMFL